MKRYPLGIQSFGKLISENCFYVDKTPFVAKMQAGGYYFLSRPRRFGKSLFLDTLKEAFKGNKGLFKGLYLENHWDWKQNYPVVEISFGGGVHKSKEEVHQAIREIIDENARKYDLEIHAVSLSGRFRQLLTSISEKQNSSVVILIDEYDKPILDNIENPETAAEIRDVLKGLYSVLKDADRFIKLAFITGVSKFSKVSLFSGLNNLTDISLNREFGEICGYTQTEMEIVFAEPLKGFDSERIKRWYNGYCYRGRQVYNPFDVLHLLNSGEFRNYWFESGTPAFLIKLLEKRGYFVPEFEDLTASDELLGSFDVDNIHLETLLFQTGYLTITAEQTYGDAVYYSLGYPNYEVKKSLTDRILTFLINNPGAKGKVQVSLHKAFLANDIDAIKTVFHSFYASIPSEWYRNNTIANYEGYYTSVFYAYLAGAGFTVVCEDVTNKGRIDLTAIFDHAVFIMEFKVNEEDDIPAGALEQIKEKKYADKYLSRKLPVYLIGCEFSKTSRNITRYEWEEIRAF